MSVVMKFIMLLLLVVVMDQAQAQAQPQSCSNQLMTLNNCAPFVVPGAISPSQGCCGALGAMQQDCLCSTLRIASTLPSLCHLPPLSCGTN